MDPPPTQECRFGARCTRFNCWWAHPPGRAPDCPAGGRCPDPACGNVHPHPCRYGLRCKRKARCPYAHPPPSAFAPAGGRRPRRLRRPFNRAVGAERPPPPPPGPEEPEDPEARIRRAFPSPAEARIRRAFDLEACLAGARAATARERAARLAHEKEVAAFLAL